MAQWICPCSEEEVAALEQKLGVSLPAAYREFLLWMGHGAGQFLQGTDVFYEALPLNDAARELLQEDEVTEPLPSDAIVFYMAQGYQFQFMRASEGDDPPVYFYEEGMSEAPVPRLYASFSAFLETEIEGHANLLGQMQRSS
ncbi:MAG TPA: SMI1/KNR4 family protein [Ktedonobacterales bacterium]|nr:SMI1/KNR4 family protein [Ktedonobacterales bacterium]